MRRPYLSWILVLGILVLPCCAEGDDGPSVVLDTPSGETLGATGPVALVGGTARNVDVLEVALTTQGTTHTFEMVPGRRLAFVVQPQTEIRRRVAWPPEDAPPPTSSDAAPGTADLKGRVDGLGWTHAATFLPDDLEGVLLDPDLIEETSLAQIVRRMEIDAPGNFRFLIQVRPTERYRRMRAGDLPPRLRGEGKAPWPESVEAFEAFKQSEVAAYVAAGRSGKAYVPTRAGFLVLPRGEAAADTTSVNDFDVLEWPADPTFRVDGSWFVHPAVGRGQTGMPVVVYDVAEERQDAFEAWTRQNVGLPMALIADGRVTSAPVINAPLTDSVQITLGSGRSYAELRAEAESIAASLTGRSKTQPGRLVAAASWEEDGTFEIVVPLRGQEVVVSLGGKTAAGHGSPIVTRTVVSRPDAGTEAGPKVDAVLAASALGMLDVEKGAALLEGLGVSGLEALAASPRRRSIARKLAVRLAPRSNITWEMLRVALEDADPAVRGKAAGWMLANEARSAEAWSLLVPKAPDDPLGVGGALSSQVLEGAPHVLEILREEALHADPQRRTLAARLWANVRDGAALEVLFTLLGDEEETVRRAALQSLMLRPEMFPEDLPEASLDQVLQRLKAEHAEARAWAAATLGSRGDAGLEHEAKLRALLDDPEEIVQAAAAWALGELGVQDEKAEAIVNEANAKAEADARAREAAK